MSAGRESTFVASCWKPGETFMAQRTLAEVRAEPMLFSCDVHTARALGRAITADFLDSVARGFPDFPSGGMVIDTRVHMLMPGFYPAIPGWHHDDVPRTGPPNEAGVAQPDYTRPSSAVHVAGIVTAGEGRSLTEYALGDAEFSAPPEGATFYRHWAPEVDDSITLGLLESVRALDRELILFDDRTWHRATPATGPCWRWFGRISRGTDRAPANEIRTQVQAYIVSESTGW